MTVRPADLETRPASQSGTELADWLTSLGVDRSVTFQIVFTTDDDDDWPRPQAQLYTLG